VTQFKDAECNDIHCRINSVNATVLSHDTKHVLPLQLNVSQWNTKSYKLVIFF